MRAESWLPLAWVLVSLGLRVGWCGLSQNLEKIKTLRGSQTLRASSSGWPAAIIRFLYFVGLPYLALISGVLTPRLLGLKGLDYFALISQGSSLAGSLQQALTLTLLEWLLDSQWLIPLSLLALLFLSCVRWQLARDKLALTLPPISGLEVIYSGLHWAFYRAAFWAATGDLYLGLVWGIGFVIIERLLLGWIQKQALLQSPAFFVELMVLSLTSLLFFYVPNLWLIWPVHLAMLAVLSHQAASPVSVQPERPMEHLEVSGSAPQEPTLSR